MEAWKLRACVYGGLAVVIALVTWQSGALAGDPPKPGELRGWTAEASPVLVTVVGDRVTGLDIAHIGSRCTNGARWRTRWYPTVTQSNVSYRQTGSRFLLHERPRAGLLPHANLYMRARLTRSGVTGSVRYTAWWPAGVRCTSETVAFSASAAAQP